MFDDPRIKIFNSTFKNVIYNFENAIKQATGDIIVLSDQDDIWTTNRLEKSLRALKDNVLVFSNAIILENDTGRRQDLLYSSKDLTGFSEIYSKTTTSVLQWRLDQVYYKLHYPFHEKYLCMICGSALCRIVR